MKSRNIERNGTITRGTGNVFADLGFSDAKERQTKLRLAYAINQLLEARKLSRGDVADMLRVSHRNVSALQLYKLTSFSPERLLKLLALLNER